MAQMNGELLLAETEKYLEKNEDTQTETETALPFETLDEYIDDPTGFGDVTAKLWQKVNAVFDLAVKYNRHSSDYLQSLSQLEKGIKYLGSSCLQKYALEKEKHLFPELSQLNTANLYTMTAVHFNKIDKALSEYMEQKNTVNDALLDMEYRYYRLMERIRATEVKIYHYINKKYDGKEDYNPVIHGLAFSKKSWSKNIHENDKPLAFQRARAFSVQDPELKIQNSAHTDQPAVNTEQKALIAPAENREMSGEQPSRRSADIDQAQTANGVQEAVSNERNVSAPKISSQQGAVIVEKDAEKTEIRDQYSEVSKERQSEENNDITESDDPVQAENPDSIPDEDIPQCIRIMNQVIMRSRIENLDYLAFTESQMRLLAADPLFSIIEPQTALDIRKALAEYDSSG